MPLYSIVPIPNMTDFMSSTTAVASPIWNEFWPVAVVVIGIVFVFGIIGWLVRTLTDAFH